MNSLLPTLYQAHDLLERRAMLRKESKKLVLTNGCFDLLHTGHLRFLEDASKLGDELWVGLNSDASVRLLKGMNRPVIGEKERAFALSSLRFVNAVFSFSNPQLSAELLEIQPDIYCKANDYTLDTLNPEEKEALDTIKAKIEFIPFLSGYNTTELIKKIRTLST